MATWTNIPDTVLEPGKPARAVDAIALRDNPVAIAEGAAGAPKVTENAMSANSIHANRLRSGTVTATQIAAGAAENAWVAARIATGSAGGVGTYAFLMAAGTISVGVVVPGSALRYSDSNGVSGVTPAGSWRIMGQIGPGSAASLWLRVS